MDEAQDTSEATGSAIRFRQRLRRYRGGGVRVPKGRESGPAEERRQIEEVGGSGEGIHGVRVVTKEEDLERMI
jgi:hypothetical protein